MTKIRVHELAKELNKDNKEVLNFLKENNIEVKSHMSTLSDEDVSKVRAHFQKPAQTEEGAKDEPKKKKLIHVFNPQNIQNSNMKRGGMRQNNPKPIRNAAAPNSSEVKVQSLSVESQTQTKRESNTPVNEIKSE